MTTWHTILLTTTSSFEAARQRTMRPEPRTEDDDFGSNESAESMRASGEQRTVWCLSSVRTDGISLAIAPLGSAAMSHEVIHAGIHVHVYLVHFIVIGHWRFGLN